MESEQMKRSHEVRSYLTDWTLARFFFFFIKKIFHSTSLDTNWWIFRYDGAPPACLKLITHINYHASSCSNVFFEFFFFFFFFFFLLSRELVDLKREESGLFCWMIEKNAEPGNELSPCTVLVTYGQAFWSKYYPRIKMTVSCTFFFFSFYVFLSLLQRCLKIILPLIIKVSFFYILFYYRRMWNISYNKI